MTRPKPVPPGPLFSHAAEPNDSPESLLGGNGHSEDCLCCHAIKGVQCHKGWKSGRGSAYCTRVKGHPARCRSLGEPEPLFDVEPRTMARTSDPAPSHEAAEAVTKSGRARVQREVVRLKVCEFPGLPAARYDELLGLSEVARKRLPELRAAGLVTSRVMRPANGIGRRLLHWFPTGSTT